MERTEIQKLSSLPIESVAERLGLTVEHHRCLCPFHDDHNPSLSLSVSLNIFRCFSCGASGDVIDLAMKVLGKGFAETCRWLAQEGKCLDPQVGQRDRCHDPVPFDASRYLRYFEHPFLNHRASEFLFGQRKLHQGVIQWCRLSSWRESLQIPYFDISGQLIGVQFRNLGISGPRFWFPSGSQCHIYNLPILRCLKPGEELYIAEGCSDCWALMSSGHKAIAIPSATICNRQTIKELSALHSRLSIDFHMWPDNDAPGENLYQSLNESLNVTRHQLPQGCKDYSDYFVKMLTC